MLVVVNSVCRLSDIALSPRKRNGNGNVYVYDKVLLLDVVFVLTKHGTLLICFSSSATTGTTTEIYNSI